MKCFLGGPLLLMLAGGAFAQDRADIDRTQIIGNRELPKVLYIVPWKKPLPGQLSGRPPCKACSTKHWHRSTAPSSAARWTTTTSFKTARWPR